MKFIISALVSSILLTGCIYPQYTTPLATPIEKSHSIKTTEQVVSDTIKHYSSLEKFKGEQTATIGDLLFYVNKYDKQTIIKTIEIESPSYKPKLNNPFPKQATWTAYYQYTDDKFSNLLVFSTPNFYKAEIGIILDKNGYPATDKPLIQIIGPRSGRRWEVDGDGPFFNNITKKKTEEITKTFNKNNTWALRYGGKIAENYLFDIINTNDPTVIEVLQKLIINEKNFMEGFIIKSILITGTKKDSKGKISYTLEDTEKN